MGEHATETFGNPGDDVEPSPARWGRWWFGLTAFAVLVGIVIQLIESANFEGAYFDTVPARIFNVFCYFTIQSNLIVGGTSLLLALRWDRRSTAFRALRLSGLTAIVLTFMVYHSVLTGLDDRTGWGEVANQILHTVVPILAVLGWLLFGPRTHTTWRTTADAVIFPIAWLIFTLIRGPIVDWYPYPFIDVIDHGYARVALNTLLVAAIFVVLAAGITLLDRQLTIWRRRARSTGAPSP